MPAKTPMAIYCSGNVTFVFKRYEYDTKQIDSNLTFVSSSSYDPCFVLLLFMSSFSRAPVVVQPIPDIYQKWDTEYNTVHGCIYSMLKPTSFLPYFQLFSDLYFGFADILAEQEEELACSHNSRPSSSPQSSFYCL